MASTLRDGRLPWQLAKLPCTVLLAALLSSSLQSAESVLFPAPLHLTRRVEEPIGRTSTVIEEYCYGNRVVAVRGARTSIADYEKGELTIIDREKATYSVSRFDEVARANGAVREQVRSSAAAADQWKIVVAGPQDRHGRMADVFEATEKGKEPGRRIRVAVDREVSLSRDAVEVLAGAAWPNNPTPVAATLLRVTLRQPAIVASSAGAAAAAPRYGLPLEQTVRYDDEGESIETRNDVIRVGSELPPPSVLEIPPGAQKVVPELLQRERLLHELDQLPNRPHGAR